MQRQFKLTLYAHVTQTSGVYVRTVQSLRLRDAIVTKFCVLRSAQQPSILLKRSEHFTNVSDTRIHVRLRCIL